MPIAGKASPAPRTTASEGGRAGETSHGSFSILLVSQMLAAIVTIVVTVLVGRVFCGWVCSFGAMEDLAGAIGHGFSARVQVPREVDRWLKLVKYVVLAVIVLCWLGIISLSASWSPWEAFALLATWPPDFAGALSGYGVGLALLAAIMCGVPGIVEEMTLDQVRRLRLAGTDERIPTLDEVLSVFEPHEGEDVPAPLIVEVKSYCDDEAILTEKTLATLDAHGVTYCVESFDPRVLSC